MASLHQLLASLRSLVTDNETAEALRSLNDWLVGPDGKKHRSWSSTVTQLKARFNRLEQQEAQGVLTRERADVERNRVNAELLELMEKIGRGESPPAIRGSSPPAHWLIAGIMGFLLLAAAVWFFWPRSEIPPPVDPGLINQPDSTLVHEPATCPDFPEDDLFRVMVLPYDVLRGDPTRFHLLVSRKIDALINRYGVDAAVRNFGRIYSDVPDYPDDMREAEALGRECETQLIVWGLTTGGEEQEESITSFRFVDGGQWRFTDYQLDESLQVDTITTLADMSMDGTFTAKIEAALRLIFGLVAHEAGDAEKTIELLEDHPVDPESDSSLFVLQQELLAEAFHRRGNTEQAVKAYTDLLAADANNLSAYQKRGTLLYQMKEYARAASDLDRVLEADPLREEARVTRAAANLQLKRIEAADRDLSVLETRTGYLPSRHETAMSDDPNMTEEEREARRKRLEAQREAYRKEVELQQSRNRRFNNLLKNRTQVAPDVERKIYQPEVLPERPVLEKLRAIRRDS